MPILKWAVVTVISLSGIRAGEISFNRDVRPILSDRCFACHGPDAHERKAKLRLDLPDGADGAYRTHEDSTAIAPGSIDDSEVWYRITSTDADDLMPPPKSQKKALTESEQEIIRRWIEGGAKFDDFWAFVPPSLPEAPEVTEKDWSDQPIDLHVLARLEAEGMKPSEDADKRTLIRRVTFDLTGLPPSLEEVQAFLADKSPKAYEALVDRLLSRKQYGEHMARYWLDLVRFADTNGMHKDFYRNFISYRDWVIRAFNDNLSYDEFVRYQLAGDLYPDATNDQLVASGFNRLHLIIDRGTALPEESFYKNVVDRVTAVGTAFMGMTVHCATCHDHKYDPLTQKDFYSLFAFFNNLDAEPETESNPKNGLQPPFISMPTPQQREELSALETRLDELGRAAEMMKEGGEIAASEPDLKAKLEDLANEFVAKQKAYKKERDQIDSQVAHAMVMKEREDIRAANIMIRGQYDAPGDLVERNTPGFLPAMKKAGETASRMDLANWFVASENPLTARVAVNRFWQQFFGVGLVKTSEDLGAQGEVPSHPELLDYLAVSFMESGWDIQALLKQIVMSRTYRQSSIGTPEQFARDPENRLLARGSRFRMDAEMVRDQILATSGLLSNTMYGKSVKPPQPDGLWKAVTMIGEHFEPDTGESIYRRSVYTYWKRAMPPPQMTILNAPVRDACVARRERTNTPSQALLLLNESEYLKAARTLAQKILDPSNADVAHRMDYAYETVTSKLPDDKERAIFQKLLDDLLESYVRMPDLADQICSGLELDGPHKKAELAAWTVIVNTLYNLDITKTRE
ncbi:MAG: PSD1 domain-containing protein [Verrucomicrobiae bacterium]|nr:PSD1 domain-containing protein [Verrucomicrobiae bacterium]